MDLSTALFYLLEGFLGPLLSAQSLPRGCLGVPGLPPIRAKLGSRRPEAKKSQGSFLPSELQSPSGPILEPFYVDFYDLLTFYQAKVQFPIKNIPFTCITAMSDACYAGKKTILKKKHHFYLHNRHLRSTQGGCYAGKSECGKGKNSLLPA